MGSSAFPVAYIERAVEPSCVVDANDMSCLSQQIIIRHQGKICDPLIGQRVAVKGIFQAARAVLSVQLQEVLAQTVGQRMYQVTRPRVGQ